MGESMRKGSLVATAIATLAVVFSIVQAQQETLGSIVDRGSKKLSAAELRSVLTSGGVSDEFADVLGVVYRADGRLEGLWSGVQVYGTWSVDNDGMQCIDAWDQFRSERWSLCRFWYRLGESTYVLESGSDADRQQPVRRAKTASR